MNIKESDFFSISSSMDRKRFIQTYFTNIKEFDIEKFFKNDWYNYHLSKIYNFLSDNHSHKCLVVSFDNDEVLVSIKFVTNFQHVYIRLQHYPKSLSNNKVLEDRVFDFLKTFSYIQLLWESEENIHKYNFEWNKRTVDTNFYDVVSERWKEMNKDIFLKKRKIKRFLKDNIYSLVKATSNDLDDVKDCFNEWSNWIKDNKGLHNKKLFDKIFKEWDYLINDSDIEVLLMKYDNLIIGCSVYVKMGNICKNYKKL